MSHDERLKIAAIGMRGIPSNYSGIERASESLYTRLAMRGHQITVYCRPACLPTKVEYYRGIRLLRMPTPERKSLDTLFYAFSSILHATFAEHYDVIHLHALATGLFSGIPRLRKIPTVATIHGLDWQRSKWKGMGSAVLLKGERSIARNASEIIAISRHLQDYFLEQYGLRVPYIPNGIERSIPMESDYEVLKSFDLSPGKFITYVGRLVPEKRIEDIIVAFRQLCTSHRLAIVGEGGYTQSYVDELKTIAGGDPRIVFTGLKKGAALETLYRESAAFVLASDLEGLPMSLLEAIERGIPAIVSDIPPHRELLGSVDGYDLFFPCRDVERLADRLRQVLENHNYYANVALRAQSFVRKNYSWDSSVDATEALFHRVKKGGRQRSRDHLRREAAPINIDGGANRI